MGSWACAIPAYSHKSAGGSNHAGRFRLAERTVNHRISSLGGQPQLTLPICESQRNRTKLPLSEIRKNLAIANYEKSSGALWRL